jgi:fumarate reductase flavoprotein subunit
VNGPHRFDVLIAGAGTAGMACAIAAAEGGASVLVVEKGSELGGSLLVAGGKFSAAATRRQRLQGIEDSSQRHFEDVMRIGGQAADAVVVRLAVEEAPATVDWLDDLGFPFDPLTPAIDSFHRNRWTYSAPRTYWGPGPESTPQMARTILETIRPSWERQIAAGRIRLDLRTPLQALQRDEDSNVHAVIGAAAAECSVRAGAIVLATGGYSSNLALFAELSGTGARPVSWARPACTGDGIIAARALGAAVKGGELYSPRSGALEVAPGRAGDGYVRLLDRSAPPRELHVNAAGRRFHAEDDPSEGGLYRAFLGCAGQRFWLIFDEEALTQGEAIHSTLDPDELRARAAAGANPWAADDIATLADRAGIDSGGLLDTVAAWNAGTALPESDPFGRRTGLHALVSPPFYALATRPGVMTTTGGLAVDETLRVLGRDGVPLGSLYAIGEILGSATTMGDGSVSGMMVTPALSLGRILGRRLAELC